jgi:ParB family chromosome partitioning protein
MAKKVKPNKGQEQEQPRASKADMQYIHIDFITPVGINPRQYFDENALQELAESIKQVGIIQPIVARKIPNAENTYSIICGERRYRAAKLAGLEQIPAYIRECTDEEALDIALTENLQREDMTDLEVAEAVQTMIDLKKMDIRAIIVKLGKSEKFVRDRYRLNNLIDDFKKMLSEDTLNIGKAVFLASYPQDLQELIHKDHFANENWQYWAELSLKKFESHLDNNYNSNLDKAQFDTAECQSCPFNSSFGRLFSDDTARCLKKSCYTGKNEFAKLKAISDVIEDNPALPVIKGTYIDSSVERKLDAINIELSQGQAEYYPDEPDKPEEPQRDDFTDEETGEFNETDYVEAIEEYRQECEDYKEAMQDYANEVLEIETKLTNGEYRPCLVLSGTSVEKGYLTGADEATAQAGEETDNEAKEIGKLNAKLNREQELKVEKTIKDLKEQVFKGSIDFTKDAVKLEQDILFFYLLSELTREHNKQFFGESYPTDKAKFDFIMDMKPEQRTVIIRDYVLSNLKQYAFNSHSVSSQLFLEFSKYHFEKETADIEKTHQDVFLRRKAKIEEKLRELGVDVLKEETDAGQVQEEPEEELQEQEQE